MNNIFALGEWLSILLVSVRSFVVKSVKHYHLRFSLIHSKICMICQHVRYGKTAMIFELDATVFGVSPALFRFVESAPSSISSFTIFT